ncbi:MAG: hypothetical protein COB53_02555 [Elusimicrobia bacterium]|nr:MAG: hypothetical protein COB53_02555 [Elusimicrobiota bacterium]
MTAAREALKDKKLWAILIFALAVRSVLAITDHVRPILPAHNYNDAAIFHTFAVQYRDSEVEISLPPGKELYTIWTAAIYTFFGETPLGPRLINTLLAAFSIALWYFITLNLFSRKTAVLAAFTIAIWPSHAFFSGQHLKEALQMLILPLVFTAGLHQMEEHPRNEITARLPGLAMTSAFLILLGFIRAFFLPIIGGSFLLGSAVAFRRWRSVAPVLLSILVGILAYPVVNKAVITTDNSEKVSLFIPTGNLAEKNISPSLMSPKWIEQLRNKRQRASQQWSKYHTSRRVETQIFPGQKFDHWGDVAAFAPKSTFYALFMPLPGLYPINGKLSRALSAFENTVLLVIFLLAMAGFVQAPKPAGKTTLIMFFFLISISSGLFEFDLGSATRHKLHYFPFLFPFAIQFVLNFIQRSCDNNSARSS